MNPAAQTRAERTAPLRSGPGERLACGIVATGSLGVLATAAWMNPSTRGHGTHTQIGLPPCSWAIWFDKPCPTCGMTTAFSHAGEAQWGASFLTQPAGAVLAIGTATAFWLAVHAAATGSRVGPMAAWLVRPRTVTLLGAGLIAAWVYKIVTWGGA